MDLPVDTGPTLASRHIYFSRMVAELEEQLPHVEEVAQKYLQRRIIDARDRLRDVEEAISMRPSRRVSRW